VRKLLYESKQTRLARAIVLGVIQDARVFETQVLMPSVSWVGGCGWASSGCGWPRGLLAAEWE